MLCPKDFKPCIDDLCRGGGCLAMGGAEMLTRCAGCGALVSDDDQDDCSCDYYDDGTDRRDSTELEDAHLSNLPHDA